MFICWLEKKLGGHVESCEWWMKKYRYWINEHLKSFKTWTWFETLAAAFMTHKNVKLYFTFLDFIPVVINGISREKVQRFSNPENVRVNFWFHLQQKQNPFITNKPNKTKNDNNNISSEYSAAKIWRTCPLLQLITKSAHKINRNLLIESVPWHLARTRTQIPSNSLTASKRKDRRKKKWKHLFPQ